MHEFESEEKHRQARHEHEAEDRGPKLTEGKAEDSVTSCIGAALPRKAPPVKSGAQKRTRPIVGVTLRAILSKVTLSLVHVVVFIFARCPLAFAVPRCVLLCCFFDVHWPICVVLFVVTVSCRFSLRSRRQGRPQGTSFCGYRRVMASQVSAWLLPRVYLTQTAVPRDNRGRPSARAWLGGSQISPCEESSVSLLEDDEACNFLGILEGRQVCRLGIILSEETLQLPEGKARHLESLHEVMDPVLEHDSPTWRRFVYKLFRSVSSAFLPIAKFKFGFFSLQRM